MDIALARLERWMTACHPRLLASLLPGAAEAQCSEFARTLGRELPPAFRALYRWHDGQRRDATPFYLGHRLVPLDEIASAWTTMCGLLDAGDFDATDWWHTGWLPLLDLGNGDSICLDLDGTLGGVPGQLLEFHHAAEPRTIIARDLESWLETFASELESGEWQVDETRDPVFWPRHREAWFERHASASVHATCGRRGSLTHAHRRVADGDLVAVGALLRRAADARFETALAITAQQRVFARLADRWDNEQWLLFLGTLVLADEAARAGDAAAADEAEALAEALLPRLRETPLGAEAEAEMLAYVGLAESTRLDGLSVTAGALFSVLAIEPLLDVLEREHVEPVYEARWADGPRPQHGMLAARVGSREGLERALEVAPTAAALWWRYAESFGGNPSPALTPDDAMRALDALDRSRVLVATVPEHPFDAALARHGWCSVRESELRMLVQRISLLLALARWNEALAMHAALRATAPYETTIGVLHARALVGAGQLAEAVAVFSRVIAEGGDLVAPMVPLCPDVSRNHALVERAIALALLGRRAEASADLLEVLESATDGFAVEYLARAHVSVMETHPALVALVSEPMVSARIREVHASAARHAVEREQARRQPAAR